MRKMGIRLYTKMGKIESDVCAIIVTYNPDIVALFTLLGQLDKEVDFYVIDNGSREFSRDYKVIKNFRRCRSLILLPENVGLACALNIGIEKVMAEGYRFALLFDQDSRLCDQYVARILSSYVEASGFTDKRIGALGPRIIHPQTQRQMKFKLFNRFFFRSDVPFGNSRHYFQADFLITSGSLLPLEAVREIGGMKESYFIDNLDLEWCFRARSKGFKLVGTNNVMLYHVIGERSANPLVRSGLILEHSPERTYYSSRNRVHLYGVSYSPWGWKIRDVVRFTLKAIWLLIFSCRRKQYWRNISVGIRDARTLR